MQSIVQGLVEAVGFKCFFHEIKCQGQPMLAFFTYSRTATPPRFSKCDYVAIFIGIMLNFYETLQAHTFAEAEI